MRDNRRRNPKNVKPNLVIPCMFTWGKKNGFAGTKHHKDDVLFSLGFLLIIRSLFCYNSLFTRSYQLLFFFYSQITKKAKTKKLNVISRQTVK